MAEFKIGDRLVGPDEPTFVIAEAGSNHNGDFDTAMRLIDEAVNAGADAVKFQVFTADKLYVDDRDLAENSAYETVSELELPHEWVPELYDYCESNDIHFMATPFDEKSAEMLAEYVPAFKIASFTLSHYPFLSEIAGYGKPIILSTGSHNLNEVGEAVEKICEKEECPIALLHCVSSYPTELRDINVKAVETLRNEFDTLVGLSDHTVDPTIAPSATVTLGGSIVEKHFTLDKTMKGPDHSFALEPNELSEMIDVIRDTEQALGDGTVSVTKAEAETASRARRILFIVEDLEEGDTVSEGDVKALRPGYSSEDGLHPKHLNAVIGKQVKVSLSSGDPVKWEKIS